MYENKKSPEKNIIYLTMLQNLKEEEEEELKILNEPFRQYLMKYIFPTLTQGLIQVAKLRPADPVEYLAEYLFKANLEGKMFEPDYTEITSSLLDDIQTFFCTSTIP
ncbi:adenylate kinase 7-like isoform X2 [Leptopilina boulardi]|uniref:adenylate kinase 7-like isoform X2 n=1 Tax=Leptopilina boulardi TaxID=63433 RepID=UPI0021F510EF|nr:adenylate kinase 7-like isoform X2 [Leptopilina boulardi]